MKRFLINISALFIVTALCLSAPLYYFEYLAKRNMAKEPYRCMNRPFLYAGENADLIVMGNSRAMHYDEDILSKELGIKCRNIGWTGFPFIYQYHGMLQTYLNRNNPPKYIIQEIMPRLFFTQLQSPYVMETLPRINEPEYEFFFKKSPDITLADHFLLPRYAGKMDKVFKQIGILREADKPEPLPNFYNEKPQLLQLGKTDTTGGKVLDRDEESIALFKQYLNECDSMGIKMVFCCSPMHVDDALSTLDMEQFWFLIDSLKAHHNITILDYEDYFGNDTTYFYDPSHLKQTGIEVYSRKVAHDLDSLGIISATQKK